MRHRLWPILVVAVSLFTGYLLSSLWDRYQIWNADQGVFARLGVRPAPLPKFTAARTADQASTKLKFERSEDSGIDFVYDNGPENQFHLAETLGGGTAALDFNNDGHVDLIFIDGGDPVRWPTNQKERFHLFRNHGAGTFQPTASQSRLSWTGYGHGCAVADVNNDGFDDVLITGYQQSSLFLNQGDGTFLEDNRLRQLTGERWCATACWADLDIDGDLDLYIACYADSPRDQPSPVCELKGVRIHCNPHSYQPVTDFLFENTGDGEFRDRSESSGISEYREYGLGVVAADLDRDGVPEIFVANDGDRNLLFQRKSDWAYDEIALSNGVAFNGQGETMGSMGVACADFDRNGRFDLFTTNFSNESNALFHQQDELMFVDTTQGKVIDQTSRALVGWAAIPLDADCDRLTDLFVANGHVTQMPGEDWAQRSSLLRGTETDFEEAHNVGFWFERPWHARGACRADLNHDGLDDLVVSLIDAQASLLWNTSPSPGHRVQLQLIGTTSPRTPEGAIIEVECASGTRLELVCRNAGYLSSNSAVVTLPLGKEALAETLRIHWPSGVIQELQQVAHASQWLVIEGRSPIPMVQTDSATDF